MERSTPPNVYMQKASFWAATFFLFAPHQTVVLCLTYLTKEYFVVMNNFRFLIKFSVESKCLKKDAIKLLLLLMENKLFFKASGAIGM
jgi:hypothetical protein